jgi:hypothetical protein
MPYCLAHHEDWRSNIIDSAAVEFVEAEIQRNREARTPFPLHKYVQHGLSSQAMLFNLVGPMAGRHDLRPLQSALEEIDIPWPSEGATVEFEYEDRAAFNERQAQPTSIDLVVGDPASAGAIFIESKLVESGFGGCSVFTDGDCDGANPASDFTRCYLHSIGRTYLDKMQEHGLLNGSLASDTFCPLMTHYQFFRELLMALGKDGYFVLLADERSPVFVSQDEAGPRGLWPLLTSCLPDEAQRRLGFLSLQSVVLHAESIRGHDWTRAFRKKYGLAGDTP